MSDARDWLVLSLKWTRDREWAVWYGTACSGYTTDLMQAGRYSVAEAMSHEDGETTIAVPLREALAMARVLTVVPNGIATVGDMKKQASERRATPPPGGPARPASG